MDCTEFEGALYAFQADELPADERQRMHGHLEDCPGCSRRLALEESFLRGLRARLGRAPAPPGLESRVRARLAPRPAVGRVPWAPRPWLAATLASVALAAILVPATLGGRRPALGGGAIDVRREATVVDVDCDRAGHTIAEQRRCEHPLHANALKMPEGGYWNLSLEGEAGRRVALGRELRGRRLVVAGEFHPRLRTLRLREYHEVDPRQI